MTDTLERLDAAWLEVRRAWECLDRAFRAQILTADAGVIEDAELRYVQAWYSVAELTTRGDYEANPPTEAELDRRWPLDPIEHPGLTGAYPYSDHIAHLAFAHSEIAEDYPSN